jgi:hypothetical protein
LGLLPRGVASPDQNLQQSKSLRPDVSKTRNSTKLIPLGETQHLLDGEELARVQVHPEVDLPKRTASDQLPLPPPNRRVLLPSPLSAAPAPSARFRLVGRRRQHAARRGGALGGEPEQDHPPRLPKAGADPYADPAPAPADEGDGGGLRGGGAEGDGTTHGVEKLVEPRAAGGVIPSHG